MVDRERIANAIVNRRWKPETVRALTVFIRTGMPETDTYEIRCIEYRQWVIGRRSPTSAGGYRTDSPGYGLAGRTFETPADAMRAVDAILGQVACACGHAASEHYMEAGSCRTCRCRVFRP